MEISEMFDHLISMLTSTDEIDLILGVHTTDNHCRMLCHGNGKNILSMIASIINHVSDDTGVPASVICSDLFEAAIKLREKENINNE